LDTNVLRTIEIEDDELCKMEGTNYFYENSRMVYWNCRKRIIDQRILNQFTKPSGTDLFYKKKLQEYKTYIDEMIKREQGMVIENIENSFEEREHEVCLVYSGKQNDKKAAYTSCREQLKNLRSDDSENNLVSEDELDSQTETIKEKNKRNETVVDTNCIEYVDDAEKLNICLMSLNNIDICLKNIDNVIEKRKLDDKLYCIIWSRKRYPDLLAKYEERTTRSKNNMRTGNVGPKISIEELLGLRDVEIEDCNRKRASRLPAYKKHLESQCSKDFIKKQ
jgi:hypothetical protein